MEIVGGELQLSAGDLVGHLSCRHLSVLDHAVSQGRAARPAHWDPLLQILWERGAIHEENFVRHLTESGFQATRIEGFDISEASLRATREAMAEGVPIIVQGALRH